MILRQLQELIGGIYDVSVTHDVYDFLVTDRDHLPEAARDSSSDEELIVAQEHDAVGVSLYLDPALLERLQQSNPLVRLDESNVADYWTALEGVSHFLYFAWNAGHDKPVTLLELELQAEIDKYVVSFWMLSRQWPQRFPAELARLLFGSTRIDPALAGERAPIYRAASLHAETFCRSLERLLRSARRGAAAQGILASLRRFYRLSDTRKLAHIARLEAA